MTSWKLRGLSPSQSSPPSPKGIKEKERGTNVQVKKLDHNNYLDPFHYSFGQ